MIRYILIVWHVNPNSKTFTNVLCELAPQHGQDCELTASNSDSQDLWVSSNKACFFTKICWWFSSKVVRVWIGSQEIHRSGRGFLGFSITTGWCSSQTKGHTSDVQPSIYEILRRIQWKLDDFWWLAPPPLCLNKQLKKCKPEMIHLLSLLEPLRWYVICQYVSSKSRVDL